MKFVFFIFMIVFSKGSFAEKSHLTCSANGTDIYFVNGVDVDEAKFENYSESVRRIIDSINGNELDNRSDIEVFPRHNTSQGLMKDVAEALYQYTEDVKLNKQRECLLPSNLIYYILSTNAGKLKQLCTRSNQCPEIKSICADMLKIKHEKMSSALYQDIGKFRKDIVSSVSNNRKIVLVGHSQGSLFVEGLRNYIKKYHPGHDQYTSSLMVAGLKKSSHKRNNFYNFTKDGVLEKIEDALLPVPERKFEISSTCEPDNTSSSTGFNFTARNHSFECYTGNFNVSGPQFLLQGNGTFTARDYFLDLLKKTVSELGNNDPSCCNKKMGKVWKPTNSFVADDVLVIGDHLNLSADSSLCGSGVVDATTPFGIRLVNSNLSGRVNLKGRLNFENVQATADSSINIDGSTFLNQKKIKDTIISGSLDASDEGVIENSKIFSKLITRTHLTIRNMTFLGDLEILPYTRPNQYGTSISFQDSTFLNSNRKSIIKGRLVEIKNSEVNFINVDLGTLRVLDSNIKGGLSFKTNTELSPSMIDYGVLVTNNSQLNSEVSFLDDGCPTLISNRIYQSTVSGDKLEMNCASLVDSNLNLTAPSNVLKSHVSNSNVDGELKLSKDSAIQYANYTGKTELVGASMSSASTERLTFNNLSLIASSPTNSRLFTISSITSASNLKATGAGGIYALAEFGDNVTLYAENEDKWIRMQTYSNTPGMPPRPTRILPGVTVIGQIWLIGCTAFGGGVYTCTYDDTNLTNNKLKI